MFGHRWLKAVLAGGVTALAWPAAAHAGPLVPIFVAAIGLTGTAAAVATFVINTAVSLAATWALSKATAPKDPVASAQARQAQVTQVQLGEQPRRVVFGRTGVGGWLADTFNTGGEFNTDWVYRVITLASHSLSAREGVWVDDKYVDLSGHTDGEVPGYNGQLVVYFRNPDDADPDFPAEFSGLSFACEAGSLQGESKVLVGYKADAPDAQSPVWSGQPTFQWVVRGLKCYDPRKDSTVPGGSGPHRWNDPSTREYSDNAEICRANFSWGIYANGDVSDRNKLWVGRGLSFVEAPPQAIFAAANLCDEAVALEGGGSEPRYRVGGLIKATDDFGVVEQWFADAVAGFIIQPDGGVRVEPGQAKAVVARITKGDIVAKTTIRASDYVAGNDRVNMVVPNYPEPSQKYTMTGGDLVVDDALVIAEGQRPLPLALVLVPYRTQVKRISVIQLRQAQYQRERGVTVYPSLNDGNCGMALEPGDWVEYPLDLEDPDPEYGVFRIAGQAANEKDQNTLELKETAASVYGFGGYSSVAPPFNSLPAPDGLQVFGVTAVAVDIEGEDGSLLPAIQINWTTPVDPAITRIRAEVRKFGFVVTSPTELAAVNAGQAVVTNGVGSQVSMEVRLVPMAGPGRAIIPSPWISVLTSSMISYAAATVGGLSSADLVAEVNAATAALVTANANLAVVNAEAARLAREARELARNQAALQVQRFDRDGRLEKLGFTADGLPNGPLLIELKGISEREVFIRSLLGVVVDGDSAFQLSDTTLKFENGEFFGERFTGIYTQLGDIESAAETFYSAQSTINGATALALSSLTGRVGDAENTISSQALSLVSLGDLVTAQGETINSNVSRIGDAEAVLVTHGTTLVTQGAAIDDLEATVSAGGSDVSLLTARIEDAETTLLDYGSVLTSHGASISSQGTSLSSLTSRVGTAESTITSQGTTLTTLGSTVSGLAGTVSTQATTIAGQTSRLDTAEATIVSQGSTLASHGSSISANASSISGLSTTVGGYSAAISSVQTSVDGLNAQWVMAVSSSGGGVARSAGIRLASGGTVSSLLFYAGEIGFTNGASDFFPLSISGGIVRMTNVEVDTIKAHSIYAEHIVGGEVTDSASADDASTVSLEYYDDSDLCTLYYTSQGGRLEIDYQATFQGTSGGSGAWTGVTVSLYVDGGLLDILPFLMSRSFTDARNRQKRWTPSAGAHTLQVRAYSMESGIPVNKLNASIKLTEFKNG